jgi:uncharacterized protein YhbP (UPF0306 family)
MADEHHLQARARELIDSQSTMALATARKGEAWTAPVYYVFYQGGFYFFSAPDSRHILESGESGQAAAAIYPFVSSWRDIRGVQMAGRIKKAGPGLKALRAVRAYIGKYPFTREFFDPGQELDLESFGERFRVRFYRFQPELVYYMDNKIRFGFREAIQL